VVRRRVRHAGHHFPVGELAQGKTEVGDLDQQKADQRRFGGDATPDNHAGPAYRQQRGRQVGETEAARDQIAGGRDIDRRHDGEKRHFVRFQVTVTRHVRQRHETELKRAHRRKRHAAAHRHACGKRQEKQDGDRQADRGQPSWRQAGQQVADQAERKTPDQRGCDEEKHRAYRSTSACHLRTVKCRRILVVRRRALFYNDDDWRSHDVELET